MLMKSRDLETFEALGCARDAVASASGATRDFHGVEAAAVAERSEPAAATDGHQDPRNESR